MALTKDEKIARIRRLCIGELSSWELHRFLLVFDDAYGEGLRDGARMTRAAYEAPPKALVTKRAVRRTKNAKAP